MVAESVGLVPGAPLGSCNLINKLRSLAQEFRLEDCVIPDDDDDTTKAQAFRACLSGTHKPVNPHRQRLLVAANKQAKLQKPAKAAASNTPAPASAAGAKEGEDEYSAEAWAAWEAEGWQNWEKPKVQRNDTAYGIARKKFLAETFGRNCSSDSLLTL